MTVRTPLELARELVSYGIPVVVCRPNLNYGRPFPPQSAHYDHLTQTGRTAATCSLHADGR